MIEYDYEDLFANHNSANLLIVQSGATLTWNSTTSKFDVTDSDYVIENDDVDTESFSLHESICSQDNLKFGLCEASSMGLTIYNIYVNYLILKIRN